MDETTETPEVKSTCPYCGVGCGVLLGKAPDGAMTVRPDPDHPANYGRLCSKGFALGETTGMDGRILAPKIGGEDVSWDTAFDTVAQRFKDTIAEHGPDSVAFYVSGQLLTEDYYLVNKLAKGFIGTANIDTNSRLCMASTVVGHKRAFGTDTVPGTYEDLEEADLVVLVGSNLAWCHPVLFQRLAAARREHGTKVVVVDPRRTSTCDIADLHLKLRPGSDVALFNGLLAHLQDAGVLDQDFIDAHTEGFEAALTSAQNADTTQTDIDAETLQSFYEMFSGTEKVVTVFSQGVNQSTSGSDKVNSIINCHLATGRIGHAGMGPLSVTGQPNAMGGRETGGLANMLAAHLDLENAEHRAAVSEFWGVKGVPDKPGLKAIDMFKAVREGKVKAIWIACTNPVVSLPDADGVAEALENCDFVVVPDILTDTDTMRLADVSLPALGWGEKDGTVTNSDRFISRQRAALPAPGKARADWDLYAEVGRRMGWRDAFDYRNAAEVFREHAALSHIAAGFGRDFDISKLADISDSDYDDLTPMQWPITEDRTGGRFFGDGQFFTPSGKARFLAIEHKEPADKRAPRFPYRLNTGRIRDQWHTMTRTAKAARLSKHLAEPFLQIHPDDAEELGLEAADIAEVVSPTGSALLRVWISDDVAPGTPFAPMHWTGETASAARVGPLIAAHVDPFSGQPESKASVVAIKKWEPAWYGFAVSTQPMDLTSDYWALSRTDGGWRAELADAMVEYDWLQASQTLFGLTATPLVMSDPARGVTRLAYTQDNQVIAALFVAPSPVTVSREFAAGCLGGPVEDLLAGRPSLGRFDPGPTVCACMDVGRNTLLAAMDDAGGNLDQLCSATGAGTNCGSCRAEIADLIARTITREAAE